MSNCGFDDFAVVGHDSVRSEKQTLAWKVLDFANLPHKKGEVVSGVSTLSCHGHSWSLKLYPRGSKESPEDSVYVSVFLTYKNEGKVKANFTIRVGNHCKISANQNDGTKIGANGNGWKNFCRRDEILASLDKGSLLIEVEIEVFSDTTKPVRPRDTLSRDMLKMLGSPKGSDVTYVIGDSKYHLHSALLVVRAPILAELADEAESGTDIALRDVDKDVFDLLLRYIYGSEPPPSELLAEKARQLLDVADRFGCVNLKLLAESELVESGLTPESAADLLLLADGKNCALLKEAALNCISANTAAVMKSPGWVNVRQSATLLAEIMEMAHSPKKTSAEEGDNLDRMTVGRLRHELQKKRLSEDGTREMLVKRLKLAQVAPC